MNTESCQQHVLWSGPYFHLSESRRKWAIPASYPLNIGLTCGERNTVERARGSSSAALANLQGVSSLWSFPRVVYVLIQLSYLFTQGFLWWAMPCLRVIPCCRWRWKSLNFVSFQLWEILSKHISWINVMSLDTDNYLMQSLLVEGLPFSPSCWIFSHFFPLHVGGDGFTTTCL